MSTKRKLEEESEDLDIHKKPKLTLEVQLLRACVEGKAGQVSYLLDQGADFCSQDDKARTPLMLSALSGAEEAVSALLQYGAPWNAMDLEGKTAGDYAKMGGSKTIYDELVNAGCRAELLLGLMNREKERDDMTSTGTLMPTSVVMKRQKENKPAYQPSSSPSSSLSLGDSKETKSETKLGKQEKEEKGEKKKEEVPFLSQRLHYSADLDTLVDDEGNAVMMDWEAPLMYKHAEVICSNLVNNEAKDGETKSMGGDVLNVGFGLGIIDTYIQSLKPRSHTIIEAHPDVFAYMKQLGWDKKPNVRICFGRWQDVLPKLLAEHKSSSSSLSPSHKTESTSTSSKSELPLSSSSSSSSQVEDIKNGGSLSPSREGSLPPLRTESSGLFDGIFFDTFGEHYEELRTFHETLPSLLRKKGVYSFFNGLAASTNAFFHDVYCNLVQLELEQIGLSTRFMALDIDVSEQSIWKERVKSTVKRVRVFYWRVCTDVKRPYWVLNVYNLPICRWSEDTAYEMVLESEDYIQEHTDETGLTEIEKAQISEMERADTEMKDIKSSELSAAENIEEGIQIHSIEHDVPDAEETVITETITSLDMSPLDLMWQTCSSTALSSNWRTEETVDETVDMTS